MELRDESLIPNGVGLTICRNLSKGLMNHESQVKRIDARDPELSAHSGLVYSGRARQIGLKCDLTDPLHHEAVADTNPFEFTFDVR